MFESIAEFLIAGLAVLIYGSEDRPRRAVWAHLVRLTGFAGAGLAVATLTGLVPPNPVWAVTAPLWILSLFIMLLAEHEYGRLGWSVAAGLAGAAVVAAGISAGL